MKILSNHVYLLACAIVILSTLPVVLNAQDSKLKALIIDGENNHGAWPKTTMMMKDFLEQTNLFTVDIARKSFTWQGPHNDNSISLEDRTELLTMYPLENGKATEAVEEPVVDEGFSPDFGQYDVVISHLGWKATAWPDDTKRAFEAYIEQGGGLVIVHAANNSFADWPEYNEMIGLGGWGGRSEKDGPYVFYNDEGSLIRDGGPGQCGSHGPQQEFLITSRAKDHPIMRGLPTEWLHTKDELYDRLRGPANNMTILATAYSDPDGNSPPWAPNVKGTGRHEPMLMTIRYGEGRIFHTALGHTDYSMECVGFITTLQRGTEWAATGRVSQEPPEDFPGKNQVAVRPWNK